MSKELKVFVVGGDVSYFTPFKKIGAEMVEFAVDANLFLFTGGEDVSPCLYNETDIHPQTVSSYKRDLDEIQYYHAAIQLNLPMVGVCRGAQFLNVMNGGTLHQHIEGHNSGSHEVYKYGTGSGMFAPPPEFLVSSGHHQSCEVNGGKILHISSDAIVESFLYESTKCFGVQWHPEWMHDDSEGCEWFREQVLKLVS